MPFNTMKTNELKQKVEELADLESKTGDIRAILNEAKEHPKNFRVRIGFKGLYSSYNLEPEHPHDFMEHLRNELFRLDVQAEVLRKELGVTE